MRAPSKSIQHSSTPSPGSMVARGGVSCTSFIGTRQQSSSRADHSFPVARLYLSETTPLSLHLGSFGSPIFSASGSGLLRRRLPLLSQQLLQHANAFIHVLLLHQERRQEAHHRVLRAVEQNALGKRRIHNRTRGDVELNSLNESAPAHSLRSPALLHNFLQLLLQIAANLVHVLQQLLFFDDRKKLQRDAARQGTTAERCPMLPGRNRCREFFLREERSQRQPRRNGLRNRYNVGRHAKALKRENRSRASEAALDLVEDQGHLVTIRQRAALAQKFRRALIDSALDRKSV